MESQPNKDRTGIFWNRYRKALAAQGLRDREADWFIKRAESFINSAKGLRLKDHLGEDLRAYLCRQAIDGMIYTHVLNKPGLAVKSPADL